MQKTRLQAVLDTVPVAVWFTLRQRGQATSSATAAPRKCCGCPKRPTRRYPFRWRRRRNTFASFKDGAELAVPIACRCGERCAAKPLRTKRWSCISSTVRCCCGLVQAAPLRDPSGKMIGAVSAGLDITERKRVEEHRLLLLNELNHRVKNTLATVQSIAVQSFRRARRTCERTRNVRSRACWRCRARMTS